MDNMQNIKCAFRFALLQKKSQREMELELTLFVALWFQRRVTLLSDYLIINECPKRLRGEQISIIMYHLCSWNEGLHLLRANNYTQCPNSALVLHALCKCKDAWKLFSLISQENKVHKGTMLYWWLYKCPQIYDILFKTGHVNKVKVGISLNN